VEVFYPQPPFWSGIRLFITVHAKIPQYTWSSTGESIQHPRSLSKIRFNISHHLRLRLWIVTLSFVLSPEFVRIYCFSYMCYVIFIFNRCWYTLITPITQKIMLTTFGEHWATAYESPRYEFSPISFSFLHRNNILSTLSSISIVNILSSALPCLPARSCLNYVRHLKILAIRNLTCCVKNQ
jgi:hypothetical protein